MSHLKSYNLNAQELPQVLIKDFNTVFLIIEPIHTDALIWNYQPILFNS